MPRASIRLTLFLPAAVSMACVAFGAQSGEAEASPATGSGTPAPAVASEAAQSPATGAPAAKAASASAALFPQIEPRWRKWELGMISEHGQKNGWKALPADSVRIIPYNAQANAVQMAFEVNLNTGDVSVLRGREEVPKIRSFKLQGPELSDLRRELDSKAFRDLAVENQTGVKEGNSLLLETNQKGEYRWRLYLGEIPAVMTQIDALVRNAYERGR